MGTLNFLPWQTEVATRAGEAHRIGRLGHALLLTGASGVGKRVFAEAFAAALLCEQSAGFGACGKCRSCLLFTAGSHPDWFVLQPEEDKRDIAIDSVRELGERLALSAQMRGVKVACVDPADALNVNAVNALLKTIEEPPKGVYLLLLSSRPRALPATLRSRCQHLKFALPPAEQASAWLAQRHPDLQPAQREAALRLAHGAPFAAVDIIAGGLLQRYPVWHAALTELASGACDPLQAAARIGKDDAIPFVRWLLAVLGDWLRARVGGAAPTPELAVGFAAQGSPAGIDWLCQSSLDTLRSLERNANAQLALEALLIGWRRVVARRVE
jgi:DNA polymerase-3 subunit delta'